VKAVTYHKNISNKNGYGITPMGGRLLKHGVRRYLEFRQNSKPTIERAIVHHKRSLKALYAMYHVKPTKFVQDVLFDKKKPKGSIFHDIANLGNMLPCRGCFYNLGKRNSISCCNSSNGWD